MHLSRTRPLAVCCLLATAAFASAQVRKPGLWELTTTITWQQSPLPTGSPSAAPHTIQVCLTQQQIDKYGAIMPQTPGCQITDVAIKPGGVTANMVCTGRMNGKGELESHSADGIHANGKIHFVGTMKVGQDNKPIEWSTVSSAVFQGPDCGTVKPSPMPDK
jgi:Protein of unknown function (DUF3617)